MKKIYKYILFWTIIFIGIYVFITMLLSKYNYEFLNWIKYIFIIVSSLGILIGTIQLLKKKDIVCSIVCILEFIIILIFDIGLFIYYNQESIVVKDNKKMIKVTHSVTLSNWIKYYDYKNIIVRGKNEQIYEAYNNTLYEYLYTIYYDEEGNYIKTVQ